MSDRGAPIYLVDDDVSVRESVGSLIRSAGFRAETFASAQEFLATLQVEQPSCLILGVTPRVKWTRSSTTACQSGRSSPDHFPDRPRRHSYDRASNQSRRTGVFDKAL